MMETTLQFRLENFEGPLDLLVALVEKHKLSVEDIPIDLLCEQYMATIRDAEERDVEVACEFLYMASELMLIKSRLLLPRDPKTDEDPRKPLIDAIEEYRRAKLAAAELGDLFSVYSARTAKEEDDLSPDPTYVADHAVDLLRAALAKIYTETRLSEKTAKEDFSGIVNAPRIPVETLMARLLDTLREKRALPLGDYLRASENRPELIARFIGILELLKSRLVSVEEEEGAVCDGVTDMLADLRVVLTATDEEIADARLESGMY
ncbi:MAG: segregation/condensation protein A [Clostridia bacterium]|nr:segregation/condensation protein A [Clostridia bacterium]